MSVPSLTGLDRFYYSWKKNDTCSIKKPAGICLHFYIIARGSMLTKINSSCLYFSLFVCIALVYMSLMNAGSSPTCNCTAHKELHVFMNKVTVDSVHFLFYMQSHHLKTCNRNPLALLTLCNIK